MFILLRSLSCRSEFFPPSGARGSLYIYIYMSLCQKVLGEDHPFFGPKCFFRFKFSLNKPNFIWKSMHQRDNKDKLDSQSQFWVSKIWKFTPSPGWKLAKEGWTFWVHASVVVLFASFFFRQFSLCCLTGHSQSFLMLVKTAHNYL